jgi:uncharacterized protein with HEPN domain
LSAHFARGGLSYQSVHSFNAGSFLQDETLKRAFVRSLEIIGEAVKKVPEDFRAKYSQVEWRKMAGTRDRLIHDYLGVDYELVWDTLWQKKAAKMLARQNGNRPI